MKPILLACAAFAALGEIAYAQAPNPAERQQHHPGAAVTAQAQPAPPASPPAPGQPPAQMPMMQMMQNMPEQCRPMMQQMMMQMMQGGMMGGAMQGGASGALQPGTMSEASRSYMQAMMKSGPDMMRAMQEADPDIAFTKGMIAHHRAAIDMAKAALQHGKDAESRRRAESIVREQEKEIAEMEEWLKKRAK